MEAPAAAHRPRVAGDREREILVAALDLVAGAGYDRLTLDAVAARAKASKATLYRRWPSKAALVVDAVAGILQPPEGLPDLPDTGSLRSDLLTLAERKGLAGTDHVELVCGLATAMYRDPELRAGLSRCLMGSASNYPLLAVLERGRDRGEVRADADLPLLSRILPAMIFFQLTVTPDGCLPGSYVTDVIDRVLLPAVRP